MPKAILHHDERLTWPGAVSLERGDGWTMPWRIPHEQRLLFHPALVERASGPAGVRITFQSDTTFVNGTIEPHPDLQKIELSCDGKSVGTVDLAATDRFEFGDLPDGTKRIELWLPQYGAFRLKGLELSDDAALAKVQDSRLKWITYGSSITHCSGAASPMQTWPAIVARGHRLNLTCLGFGGQCHLDPMIARVMRDRPADFLSMCVGINIMGGASLNARTFAPGIIGFVQIVREKHPETPFVVMSPIFSPPREEKPNVVGLDLKTMRSEVQSAVQAMREVGDPNVYYVNGLDVFGPDLAGFLPDDLHPDAEGYRRMGANFLEKVAQRCFV